MDFFDSNPTPVTQLEPQQNTDGLDFLNSTEPQTTNNNNTNINNDPFQSNPQVQNVFEQVQPQPIEQIDEEEMKRQQDRLNEENERRKKIEEKHSIELSKKNELREKAVEYINEFEEKRRAAIELRKKENIKNEEYFLSNKKLEKEGKKNAWEIVTDNITLKESEYKGTKDVSRMRNVIVARKNDNVNSTSQPGF